MRASQAPAWRSGTNSNGCSKTARAGKIQRILVKSVSPFARNTLELIETTRELKDLGVVVVFEEQGIDTAQMLGRCS